MSFSYTIIGTSLFEETLFLFALIGAPLFFAILFGPASLNRYKRIKKLKYLVKELDWKYVKDFPLSLWEQLRMNHIVDSENSHLTHLVEGNLGEQKIRIFNYSITREGTPSQTVVGYHSTLYKLKTPVTDKKWFVGLLDNWVYIYKFTQEMPIDENTKEFDIQSYIMKRIFDAHSILDQLGAEKTLKEKLEEIHAMNDELKKKITIYPQDWPDKPLRVKPGNLDTFASKGVGPCCGLTLMPWQDEKSLIDRLKYYSFDKPSSHPFAGAPRTEESGGIVYYSEWIEQPSFNVLLATMGVSGTTQYAAFIKHSQKPEEESYLSQMRIVSRFGLRFMYHAINEEEYESFPEQKCSLYESLWLFMEDQRRIWTDENISGTMGGDGDMAFERLAFGFMTENSDYGIYRIWSRAWLITK